MQTLNQDIKEKSFKKIYLLYGDEPFLVGSYKKKLREAITGGDTLNFNYFEGKNPDVKEIIRLADTGKARTDEELEQYLQEKTPVVKFEAKETPPDFTIEGLALTDKPVKLFYGKNFKPTETRRLNDLGDCVKVTILGDVFATEVNGSLRKIYFTSITD